MIASRTVNRKWLFAVSAIAVLWMPQIGFAQANKQARATLFSLQEAFVSIAEEVEPAVVTITAQKTTRIGSNRKEDDGVIPDLPFGRPSGPRSFRSQGTGSGVIISSDGWILTNDHVVGGADRVTVKLIDGREFQGTVRRDFRSDLALVKVEGATFPSAKLGDSDKVKIGQWAIAIGSPYRYEGSFSVGVISSLARKQLISERGGQGRLYPNMIQTDAAINPGNSGGPLVNIEGEVVAINTAIESETGGSVGIGFAIPINSAKFVIEQLKSKGKVSYGYLGIDPDTVGPRLAATYKVSYGALVRQEPDPASPAGKAGLQVEDVIISVNEKAVKNETDLRTTVSRIAPGTQVKVAFVRNGVTKVAAVTLGEMPDLSPAIKEAPKTAAGLGIEVVAITADAASKVNLTEMSEGVLIKSIADAASASESEFTKGDLILQINSTPTPNVAAFQKATQAIMAGDVVRVRWIGKRGTMVVKRVALITVD